MEDVKRYDHACGMLEFDTGPFVRFGDYAALRAEVERLTAERDAALSRIEKARVILLYRGNGMSDVSIMDRALAALTEVPT